MIVASPAGEWAQWRFLAQTRQERAAERGSAARGAAASGSAAALGAGCEGLGSGGAGSAAGTGVLPALETTDDAARSGGVLDANQYHPAVTRTRAASVNIIARRGPRLATSTGTAECVIGNVSSARTAADGRAIVASDRNDMSSRVTERAALVVVAVGGGGVTGFGGVAVLVGAEVRDIVASERNGMSAVDACAAFAGVVVRGAVTGFGGAAMRGGTTVCAGPPGLGEVAALGGAAV